MYVYIYIYNEQSYRASHKENRDMKRHDYSWMNEEKYIFICMHIYTYTQNIHVAHHNKKNRDIKRPDNSCERKKVYIYMYVYIYVYNEQSCRASPKENGDMKRYDYSWMNEEEYIFIYTYIYTFIDVKIVMLRIT